GEVFPINKPLWTSSYVLFAGGLSLLLFGLCAWLIDVQGLRGWSWPFLAFGSNPILAFVGSGLIMRVLSLIKVAGPDGSMVTLRTRLYAEGFPPCFEPHLASLLFALAYVLVWLVVVAVLYRLRIFVRV